MRGRRSGRTFAARFAPTTTWATVRSTSRSGTSPANGATSPLRGCSAASGRRLPVYASTYHGQEEPGGLDTPQAFADYAVSCKQRGFAGFKIHGWHTGDVDREVSTVLGVRKAVGDGWPLMLDPASQLRTWRDALRVGRACDEAGFFWYEDPYRDTGGAVEGHKRLRERLETPLLVCEHVRGLEAKAAFILGGGGDLMHADPEYDMGITGALKIAHFCQALGLDVQYHACGPAHRAIMAATPNTHFYEMALIGPDMPNTVPPVYSCGYSDQAGGDRRGWLRPRARRPRPRRRLRLGLHRAQPGEPPCVRPREVTVAAYFVPRPREKARSTASRCVFIALRAAARSPAAIASKMRLCSAGVL